SAWHALERPQFLFRDGHVLVREHMDLCLGEAATVDDARVVQRIGNDVILWGEDGRYRTGISREAGLEHDARFDVFEGGDALLQFQVDRHRTCDGTHGAGAYAEFPGRLDGRFFQLRMVGEAEIIVRGEIDDILVVKTATRFTSRLQFAQLLVSSCLAPLPQLTGKI